MIAALLARWVIPTWLAKLAGIAALVALLAGGIQWYHHDGVREGEAKADARHALIDAENSRRAQAELAQLNAKVAQAQADLTAALADVAKLEQEVKDAQAISTARQRDLLAGRERMSVLVRQLATAQAGSGEARPAAGLDQAGSEATATLDGRVASDLEWARQTRNEAIVALNACVKQYDAAKDATDKAGQ